MYMKGVIIKIIVVFITLYVWAMLIIALDWMRETKTGLNKIAKFAIVYGSKIELDGTVSDRLKARLDTSISLLDSNKVSKIIVSWWYGLSWYNEWEKMADYLLEQWVVWEKIIIDTLGTTTMKSSKNAFKISTKEGNYPNVWVIWVSQYFHLSRVRLSLRNAWFVNIGSVAPEYKELRDIYSLAREVPAYITYFFQMISQYVDLANITFWDDE